MACSQSREPSTTITEDKVSWTEKQAVGYLYEYLVNKAEQLQAAQVGRDASVSFVLRGQLNLTERQIV